jgi:hypothetical protein
MEIERIGTALQDTLVELTALSLQAKQLHTVAKESPLAGVPEGRTC